MKKINTGEKYWLLKFFTALIVVSLVGTLAIEASTAIFGIIPVFVSCCVIVGVSGLLLIFAQIKQKTWNPKRKQN